MSGVYADMAHDAGYCGDEALQMEAALEQQECDAYNAAAEEQAMWEAAWEEYWADLAIAHVGGFL
jgi:hypothetical protein